MSRILVRYSRNLVVLSTSAFVAVIPLHVSAQAGQSLGAHSPYSAADPFDPSEVVTHDLKDDIRLRLRLPAPDLPPSIVASTPAKMSTATPLTNRTKASQAKGTSLTEPREPGLIRKSIQSVMSIFDWSDEATDKAKKTDAINSPLNSDEPIRINIHVGITKPKDEQTVSEEVSSLETPWDRNQERVRRLFTFDNIKAHN